MRTAYGNDLTGYIVRLKRTEVKERKRKGVLYVTILQRGTAVKGKKIRRFGMVQEVHGFMYRLTVSKIGFKEETRRSIFLVS